MQRPRSLAAVGALAAILVLGCVFHADGSFFRWGTHRGLLRQISVPALLACGMTPVILSAGIDLAVGSVLALAAVAFAQTTLQWNWPWPLAVPATVGLAALCGVGAGLLVARYRLQAFLATLAWMVFARGLARALSGGQKVTTAVVAPDGTTSMRPLPAIFEWLDAKILGEQLSVVTVIMLAAAAATWVLLERHVWGRHLRAIGANESAARLSGVRVQLALVAAYAWCAALAGLAGICQAAQETHGNPATAVGIELDAIAMVVVGGTSLAGGRGGVGLTLIGALTIGYLQKILSLNQFSTDARLMLTGAILIAAALLQVRKPSAAASKT